MPEASTPDPPVMSLVRRGQRSRGPLGSTHSWSRVVRPVTDEDSVMVSTPLYLTALCERLPARQDQQCWGCLDELADGEECRACMQQELPSFRARHDSNASCEARLELLRMSRTVRVHHRQCASSADNFILDFHSVIPLSSHYPPDKLAWSVKRSLHGRFAPRLSSLLSCRR